MKRKIDLTFLVLILMTLYIGVYLVVKWNSKRTLVNTPSLSTQTNNTGVSSPERLRNIKVQKLEKFFRLHKSPLYAHARLIVEEAERYDIDYRLVPAIAMNESTLCRNIHEGSYNCWGWGIYGNTVTRFDNYEDAIQTISRGLRTYYYGKGMSSPSAIMKVYTPSSPDGVWAKKIEWAYRQIDKQ